MPAPPFGTAGSRTSRGGILQELSSLMPSWTLEAMTTPICRDNCGHLLVSYGICGEEVSKSFAATHFESARSTGCQDWYISKDDIRALVAAASSIQACRVTQHRVQTNLASSMTRAAAKLLKKRIVGAGSARKSANPPSAIFDRGGFTYVLRSQ